MRRSGQTSREPALFDLPLMVDPEIADGAGLEVASRAERRPRGPVAEAEQIDLPAPPPAEDEAADGFEGRLSAGLIGPRFLAGAIDAGFGGLALGVLVSGASLLGAPARGVDWPAYLLALLVFSFFYAVFSLTFWGRTPGMLRAGLSVSSRHGGPVTIGQAVLRWAGGVATVGLLGLPTLLALLERRSLADYLSGTRLAASG